MKLTIITIFIALTLVHCSNPNSKHTGKKSQEAKNLKNGIVFYRIDDNVKVYVNERSVYESDLSEENATSITVDLSQHLRSSKDKIRIALINEDCSDCETNWQVLVYEFYKNGEVQEYMSEVAVSKDNFGEVWDIEYVWGEL